MQKVGAQILADFTKIDILVNNAGVTRDGLAMRMSIEDWDAVINTNLRGAFNFTQAILRAMIKQRSGRILNITSEGGIQGNERHTSYCAAKSGVLGMTFVWALELADFWNANVERWTAVTSGPLCTELGIAGYFVRTAPMRVLVDGEALHDRIPVRNRNDLADFPADQEVGTDFLQLVRFGLRAPDDPLVRDSLAVVDHLLKIDFPAALVEKPPL